MRVRAGAVAVVTGAGSGIGAALARELAGRGARLALCDIDLDAVERVARTLPAPAVVARVDVSDAQTMQAFADRTRAELGVPALVFANAGVSLTGDFLHGDPADFAWVVDVNLWGVVHTARAFLPGMVEAGEGRFVAVSSVFGIIGVPNQTAYCATKAAVRGFAESLDQELAGTGVGVTCVHPGAVATNIVRGGRFRETVHGLSPKRAEALIDRGMSPDRAASIVLDGVERGQRRVLVGGDARLLDLLQRLFPVRYRDLVRWGASRF
jgi:NADP-dependent 3-hydroxy acid dehydrogenase YdfG